MDKRLLTMRYFLAVLFLLAGLVACGDNAPETIPEPPSTLTSAPEEAIQSTDVAAEIVVTEAVAPDSVAAPATLAPPTIAPAPTATILPTPTPLPPKLGAACIGTPIGIDCLSADGVWDSAETSPTTHIIACPNETLFAASSSGLYQRLGTEWVAISHANAPGTPQRLACGDQPNTFWVVYHTAVAHFDGSTFTNYGLENFGNENISATVVKDILRDPSGDIWVATATTLARFNQAGWEPFVFVDGLNTQYLFTKLLAAENGQPLALSRESLVAWNGEEWQQQFTSIDPIHLATHDKTGTLWAATDTGIYHGNVEDWELFSDAVGANVTALAVDDRGRVFAGTGAGLWVSDGENTLQYDMDSAELSHPTINTIAVVNAGPTLPATSDKPNGALTGRAQSPITRVQLCSQQPTLFFSSETPCGDQANAQITQVTGDTFTFNDVPVGRYFVAFETEQGWGVVSAETPISPTGFFIQSSATTNIGTITNP